MAVTNNEDSVLLKVSLDDSGVNESIDSLGDKFNDLNNKPIGSKSIGEFKKQLDDANNKLKELSKNASEADLDEEYKKATQELEKLTSQYEELIQANNGFHPESTIESFQKSLNGVTDTTKDLEKKIKDTNQTKRELFNEELSGSLKSYLAQIGGQFGFIGDAIGNTIGLIVEMNGGLLKMFNIFKTGSATTAATTTTFKALRVALVGLGIGVLLIALSALIENWDKVKKAVDTFIPSLTKAGGIIDKVMQALQGAVRVVYDFGRAILSLDFTNFSTAESYAKGVNEALLRQRESYHKKDLEQSIKALENKREIYQAEGRDTKKIDQDILNYRKALYKDDEEEYKKVIQDQAVFNAQNRKAEADKRKAAFDKAREEYKALLDKYKEYNKAANQVIQDQNTTEIYRELKAVSDRYAEEIKLAEKLHKDTTSIEEAKQIELNAIKKKYADEINNYLQGLDNNRLSSFDKQRKQINDTIKELLKNATPEQAIQLLDSQTSQLSSVDAQEKASNTLNSANTNLTSVEDSNRINVNDTPESAKAKIEAIAMAQLEAENAAFELEKLQKQDQADQLEAIEAEHRKKINDIVADQAAKEKAIDDAKKDARLANIDAVGQAAGALSQLIGEQTVAGKALGVAQATIDTYVGANKALAQGGLFGIAAAATIIATGLMNVKKILSTKIEGVSSNGSSSSSGVAAPVINTTVFQERTQDVRVIEDNTQQEQRPIRAYIVQKDLDKSTNDKKRIDQLSSIN